MNLDERLEALTHSVKLIAQMLLKAENEIRKLGRYVRVMVLDHEARLLALEKNEGDSN
jgi:uncharacterized protein GlcG (DUF336 family)